MEQGPPLNVESPVTVIVMEVADICGSEYSTENVSFISPEYEGTYTLIFAPSLTRNVYPPGHTL